MATVRPFYFALALCPAWCPDLVYWALDAPARCDDRADLGRALPRFWHNLRRSSDGRATRKAARRTSRPIPSDPSRVVGFDVEVAELIARGLGREPRFVEVAFASIDQSIVRGDADIGLSGIEDTPARRAGYAVTLPYYQFREVLSVRAADAGQFRTLADLRGRRVGTLGGTIAYEILLAAERDHGIVAVSYDDDVHPYSDLLIGRLDAVLLDNVLADRRSRTTPGFITHPEPVAVSHYVGVLAPGNEALRDRINGILLDGDEGRAPRGDLPEVEDLE